MKFVIYLALASLLLSSAFCDRCDDCQRTVYQLKFDRITDCNQSHCVDTCRKILYQWNQQNGVFLAFQKDLVGKCDVCFRAGYCSITQCDDLKDLELKVVNQVVESGYFRGRNDQVEGVKRRINPRSKRPLTQSQVEALENDIRKSLEISKNVENAKVAASQVQQLVTVLTPDNSPKPPKLLTGYQLAKQFFQENLDTQLNLVKNIVEEFTANKQFKVVASTFTPPKTPTENEATVKKVLNSVQQSINEQLTLSKKELTKIEKKIKKVTKVTQTILKRGKGKENLGKNLKGQLNSLEGDSKKLEEYKKGLTDQIKALNEQLLKVKSLSFKNGK